MYPFPFIILGTLLAWATVYAVGFRKQRWAEFLLGFAAFFIAMLVQNPVQQLPLLGVGIRSNEDVVARGMAFTVAVALWLGLAAGFVQEGVKYAFVRERKLREAVFVGLGFGVTEAVFMAVATALPLLSRGLSPEASLLEALFSMGERYFVTLFHVGTAVLLTYYAQKGAGKRGLLYMVGLHTVLDTGAAYSQLAFFMDPRPVRTLEVLAYGLEVTVAVVGTLVFAYGALKALGEPEVEEKPIW
ncbi:YhfC family intramembrane metalloprotease [Thermococcus waiotapuensis]|uniref:YhfC family intramembrane metalloprotease n=1 Tax=Thermococcus waiotapuensis TaxID=90909 RepID=A0AAE4T1Z1_9EURY|nr:YhfC family intramembrane metalloprotease [Thermococcus waiotapuensis]MDV3104765.1 YhfC family intramembrane metalloprotease [Thermococcus waiotapuensis]